MKVKGAPIAECNKEVVMGFPNFVDHPGKGLFTPPRICTKCGSSGTGNLLNKGHFVVEIVIWLGALNWFILIFPLFIAIMFSVWRRVGRQYHCYSCGGLMIPTSSPFGKSLLKYSDKRVS